MDLPNTLSSHQAAALVSIVTHIIHNPKAVEEVIDNPENVLINAGLSSSDIEAIGSYVKALRSILREKIWDDNGSVW